MNAKDAQEAGILFYKLPSELEESDIDPLIRDTVIRINESGWVWTAESCQGHPDMADMPPWGLRPMLRLVCRGERLGDMLAILYRASGETLSSRSLIIYHDRSKEGWEEMIVHIDADSAYTRNRGLEVFDRFSRDLHRGE